MSDDGLLKELPLDETIKRILYAGYVNGFTPIGWTHIKQGGSYCLYEKSKGRDVRSYIDPNAFSVISKINYANNFDRIGI